MTVGRSQCEVFRHGIRRDVASSVRRALWVGPDENGVVATGAKTFAFHWLPLAQNGRLAFSRQLWRMTATRRASEEKRQFPRLRFGLLSNRIVDATTPKFPFGASAPVVATVPCCGSILGG